MQTADLFDPLVSSASPVIAYFDLKSPYAFIAKDPTRALEKELGLTFDWRPLTLDIGSYLGTAKLNKSGKVAAAQRSAGQWGSVKYAYRDARRYARLQGYPLRGTEKIWDTSLFHIAWNWVQAQQPEALERLLDLAYPPFWQRDLDVEALPTILDLLKRCAAPTKGFEAYAEGDGRQQHDQEQAAIFAAGIFGVPTYVFEGQFWFGREHLPVLKQRIMNPQAALPDISYDTLFGEPGRSPGRGRSQDSDAGPLKAPDADPLKAPDADPLKAPDADPLKAPATDLPPVKHLDVHIDLREAQSYLGLEPTLAMLADTQRQARWLPFAAPPAAHAKERPRGSMIDDRSGWHRYHRASYRVRTLEEQAQLQRLDISARYRDSEVTAFNRALLWLANQKTASSAIAGFLRAAFDAYWITGTDLNDPAEIDALLTGSGLPAQSWAQAPEATEQALADMLDSTRSMGEREGPRFIIDDEPFSGRAHIPLVTARLRATSG